MTYKPGFIWGQQGAAVYKRRVTGEGETFKERKRSRVICTECGGTMAASSLRHHMEISHGIVLHHTRGMNVRGGCLETYVISFLWILKLVECPVKC